jgi:alpha-beta hydrolase superfamily lysophospholipase
MIWWACLALAIALLLRGLVWWRQTPVHGAMRHGTTGQLATLSRGVTHYTLEGPQDGPLVVLIHGLTTPAFVWDGIAPVLVARGYRVLRYDLFGRGCSDRPRWI